MDNLPTYEEALVHFQAQTPMWEALCGGVRAMRDSRWSDFKRNMETPECNQKADDKVIGAMIAMDDVLYEFETQWELQEAE